MPTLPPRPLPPRRRRASSARPGGGPAGLHRLAGVLVERVRWVGPARAAAGAVTVIGVVAGGYWLVRPPALPVEASLPFSSTAATPAPAPATAAPAGVTVHVAGAVRAPGVYTLGEGARVVDAVGAAGGMSADADGDRVNLAARLADGERVFVPRLGEADPLPVAGQGATGATAPAGPVDLNTATASELETLPGIGPTTAAAIVAYRDLHGPFASVDDLGEVTGIGPSKLEALRGLVTV